MHLWGGPMDRETVTITGETSWFSVPMPPKMDATRWSSPAPTSKPRTIEYAIKRWGDPASRCYWWLGVPHGYPLDRIAEHINGAVALFVALGWVSRLCVSTEYGTQWDDGAS